MNWRSARTSYFLIFKRSKGNFCRLTVQEEAAMIKIIYPLAVTLVMAAQISIAFAQERLRLAWAGFSPTNSPIWVIEDRKLMQKQGVTPEIIAINASPTVLQALLANEIEAASISVTTLTSSRLAGADTVMIVGVVPTFVDHIVSLSNITAVEQLKGKTAGVNRLGSTSDLGLRLALRKLGVDPDKDVKIIPTGGTAERFAALSKGITQFTIIPEPFLTQAEKLGFRNLYNVTDLKIPFWWNGIMSRDAIVKAKRPLMLKLTRAMIEAIYIIKTEKEYAKALFKKNLGVADPEGLERAYKDYSNVFPEVPYPTPDGVKTMLDDMAPKNPKAATADAKTYVDLSLVAELEKSGFIKQLYKK
jgi:NitT/TauT family transport system substrate-binding protein